MLRSTQGRLANGDAITITVTNAGATNLAPGNDQTSGAITFTFNTAPDATSGQFSTLNELKALIDSNVGMSASVVGGTLTVTGDPRSSLVVAVANNGARLMTVQQLRNICTYCICH